MESTGNELIYKDYYLLELKNNIFGINASHIDVNIDSSNCCESNSNKVSIPIVAIYDRDRTYCYNLYDFLTSKIIIAGTDSDYSPKISLNYTSFRRLTSRELNAYVALLKTLSPEQVNEYASRLNDINEMCIKEHNEHLKNCNFLNEYYKVILEKRNG